ERVVIHQNARAVNVKVAGGGEVKGPRSRAAGFAGNRDVTYRGQLVPVERRKVRSRRREQPFDRVDIEDAAQTVADVHRTVRGAAGRTSRALPVYQIFRVVVRQLDEPGRQGNRLGRSRQRQEGTQCGAENGRWKFNEWSFRHELLLGRRIRSSDCAILPIPLLNIALSQRIAGDWEATVNPSDSV